MIKGQEKICSFVDKCTLDAFPRSLMLVGDKGAGKHLLCEYICEHFNLESIDITESISLDLIDQINARVSPYLYIIKINNVSIKEENTILKLLEEPLKNAYLVLLSESENGILPTIINRCQVWRLQNYSKEQLRTFLSSENKELLEIVSTPGQIIELENNNFSDMYALCDKIVSKIHQANIPNILTITNKLAFKDEKGKFDYRLILSLLQVILSKYYKETNNISFLRGYTLLSTLIKSLKNVTLDPKPLFDKWLLEYRSILKG